MSVLLAAQKNDDLNLTVYATHYLLNILSETIKIVTDFLFPIVRVISWIILQ